MGYADDLFDLTDRVVLITGGSRGLGREMAFAAARCGADVIVASRKYDTCVETAKQIEDETGRTAMPYAVHVGRWDELDGLVEAVYDRFGKLDVLVNNAGMSPTYDKLTDVSEKLFDSVVNLNLKAPFFLTQALATQLRTAAKVRPAKVINIASIDGVSVNPLETYSYAASKAGLIHLTRRMALRLIQDNIVVTAIAPGAFASDMNKDARDHADAVSAHVPAGRIGSAEDMAGAAIYLASRAGDYVVGSTLVVDGGVTHARG